MKTHLGSEGRAPLILNLGIRWRWAVNFTSRPSYLWGNSPHHPSDRRTGWPQTRSGRGGEEKKIPSHFLPRIEPRSSSP